MQNNKCYKGEYDRIISLGMDCRPKVIMDITGLNGKRTPLDVVGTQSIKGLVHVLENGFDNFFLRENLFIQPNSDSEFKRVRDTHTGYISIHDFDPSEESISEQYPAFRQRLDRHISNFLTDIRTCNRVLFLLNLEMSPAERDFTDDIGTLRENIPNIRELLDELCGNKNSQLFVATFHEELLSLDLPRTHIALKRNVSSDWSFMKGQELEQWQYWLNGVWISVNSQTQRITHQHTD